MTAPNSVWMRSCQEMGVEKVRKDDTARTFEFLFRFNKGVDKWQVIIIIIINPREFSWHRDSRHAMAHR